MSRRRDYYAFIITTKHADLLSDAIITAEKSHARVNSDMLVTLTCAVLDCVQSKQLGRLALKLTDAQTHQVLATINSHSFGVCLEFLWAHSHRESMEDASIIAKLFTVTLAKLENDDHRDQLTAFLGCIASQFTSDWTHWFSLLDPGVPPVQPLRIESHNDVMVRAKTLLAPG